MACNDADGYSFPRYSELTVQNPRMHVARFLAGYFPKWRLAVLMTG